MAVPYEVPPLVCGNCHKSLPWAVCNTPNTTTCPTCSVGIYAAVFPAMFRPPETGKPGETILTDEQASCFYHPQKKAVVSCASCGRFLCALCDLDFNGQHLCTLCLEAGNKKKKIKNLENRRVLYDDLALSLAIVPLITVYLTLVTAPIALFVAIRHWKDPTSIIPRGKLRFILAIVLALLQLVGWVVLIGIMIKALSGVK